MQTGTTVFEPGVMTIDYDRYDPDRTGPLSITWLEVQAYEVMDAEMERQAFTRLDWLKKRVNELARLVGRGELTPKALRETRAELNQGKREMEQIIEYVTMCNNRLVLKVANSWINQGLSQYDLLQEGRLGLLRAIAKFEIERGYKFSTYATWWIRQSISRAVADQGGTIRIPIHQRARIGKINRATKEIEREHGITPDIAQLAEYLDMGEEEIAQALEDSKVMLISSMDSNLASGLDNEEGYYDLHGHLAEDETIEKEVDESLLEEKIGMVLSTLDCREQTILEYRYGLNGRTKKTLFEIGQLYGVTRERIRQIEAEAIRVLRESIEAEELRPFWEVE